VTLAKLAKFGALTVCGLVLPVWFAVSSCGGAGDPTVSCGEQAYCAVPVVVDGGVATVAETPGGPGFVVNITDAYELFTPPGDCATYCVGACNEYFSNSPDDASSPTVSIPGTGHEVVRRCGVWNDIHAASGGRWIFSCFLVDGRCGSGFAQPGDPR